jgi:predicted lipase
MKMMLLRLLALCLSLFVCTVYAAPNFTHIKQGAQLSNIAYSQAANIENELNNIQLPLIKQAVLPDTQVSYFLTQINGVQVITIRGTANAQNVMVDLDINLKKDEALGIQVHQGFALSAAAVYEDVKPLLNKGMPVETTGHSLGGAVAVLLGMYLQVDGYNLQAITTFGQPKVSNVRGSIAFSNLPLTRIVTPKDLVPLVPPLSPMQIKELDIYWHSGVEIILLDGNKFSETSGIKSMMRATKIVSSLLDERNLHAHQMSTYLKLINLKLKDTKEVPYKMGINLFGLSIN